ncbi:MAG TPA: transketolase C-terminal domain-containing protein [Bacteroidales bacterium]|nr:transketolase C-terminal domain-containing protein [Bacteroidales bacterium]HPR11972.1 transketolase C-terminal domain-containing protein [Bacteroidales bacterium]HRW86429.1 transketolase C-terminal domain-containing protein [Bacteroidales bacterium]
MTITDQLIVGRTNLEVYCDTLIELASNDDSILVVTSDSRGSSRLIPFAERFPEQIVEVGIAEQNVVGVAAGLASTNKKIFVSSPGCFLSTRSLEQIKNDVAYSDYPVNLVGISSGVSYGALGTTHHSLHDLAVLRAIHNIIILVPSDNFETRESILAAAASDKPFYIRFGKKRMTHLHTDNDTFEIGKASTILDGNDIAFIACGETVLPAVEASKLLLCKGINARVLSMHTIKPLDTGSIIKAAGDCRAVIVVEEHSINGGLGEACATIILEAGMQVPFKRIGIPDEDTVTGSQMEVFNHYGISASGLTTEAEKLLRKH